MVKEEKLEMKIPTGVDNGSILRVSGMGHNGGDLNVYIRVIDDPVFQRQGRNLFGIAQIPFMTALGGGKAETKNIIDETIVFDIPKACPHGAQIMVPGQGVCGGTLGIQIEYTLPDLKEEDIAKIEKLLKKTV